MSSPAVALARVTALSENGFSDWDDDINDETSIGTSPRYLLKIAVFLTPESPEFREIRSAADKLPGGFFWEFEISVSVVSGAERLVVFIYAGR